jgi:hypothetical protein
MEFWNESWIVPAALAAFVAASLVAARRLSRCEHPSPHFVRAGNRIDAATGANEPASSAHYICYECGRSWPAETHDPAWHPSGVIQKFSGYDQRMAARAATRAAIEADQRRALAGKRSDRLDLPGPKVRRARRRVSNVVNIGSRKPA